ncbi:MAG: cytochrome b5 domain-containing protein [Actinobacteria bacterium]|nr:cytochrome b5 domain-containing protein [Actinomycetota bacterium]
MLTPLESGLFDAIAGLPLHPLVVHFAVVLLPLAALGLVVLVAAPKWADRFGWLTLGALAAGAGAAFVAKESGEALAHSTGLPKDHASWGDLLPGLAAGLVVLAGIWFFLHRRGGGAAKPRSMAATVSGVLTALLALIVTGVTVLVGHSGAEAAWGGTVTGGNDQPPAATGTAVAPSATASASATGTASATSSSATYTMAEVRTHADSTSCWSVVNDNVYDLTTWIDRHPGGPQRILAMCGKDATAAFTAQHGSQGRANQMLKGFLLGPLS